MVRPHDAIRTVTVDDSIAVDEESAFDRAMAWLAMYVPTVGTSVTLHVALVVLAAFLIPFAARQPPAFDVHGNWEPLKPPPEVERRHDSGTPYSRSFLKHEPESVVIRPVHLKVPSIGENPLAREDLVIGPWGSAPGGGTQGFFGDGGGIFWPPPSGPDGAPREARVVYLVDRSGSMTDSLDYVKFELKKRLLELDEAVSFHVIFYSSGPPVEMPTRRLVPATERNKRLASDFIDEVIAQGGTDPSRAFERAFAAGPEVVYFLTDGEFDKAVVDQVRRLNADGKVAVHTIQFLYTGEATERLLKQIARENGGRYKFVTETDLVPPDL